MEWSLFWLLALQVPIGAVVLSFVIAVVGQAINFVRLAFLNAARSPRSIL